MNAIFLKTEDLVLEYTKLKYPEKIILSINDHPDILDVLSTINIVFEYQNFAEKNDVILIPFDNSTEAIIVLEDIYNIDESIYCCVIENGEIIYDTDNEY